MKVSNKISTGESIIINYTVFHNYQIEFGKSYSFLDGLHGDVFIPSQDKNKIPTIIEYDGSQHFYGWGNNNTQMKLNSLSQNKNHDNYKDAACILNKVHLIRIEDMKDLSSSDYILAVKHITKILDEELPAQTHGVSIRFVSISPHDLTNRYELKRNKYKSSSYLFRKIINYVKTQDSISTSKLQQTFSIGFNRSHSIMKYLIDHNIVDKEYHNGQPRKVLQRSKQKVNIKCPVDTLTNTVINDLKNLPTISTSKLQRMYSIGYNRANRIIQYLLSKNKLDKNNKKNGQFVIKELVTN